jgi:deoxycytidine triphosphate deaminase
MLKHVINETTETTIEGLDSECVQPNAVDLRVRHIEDIDPYGTFVLLDKSKEHCKAYEMFTEEMTAPNGETVEVWRLPRGYYRVELDHRIEVGEHECGWVVPRSTLIRNGVMIHTALYDSGYKGGMVCGMQVTCGEFVLERNARIGQYICAPAECVIMYNGSYGDKPKKAE